MDLSPLNPRSEGASRREAALLFSGSSPFESNAYVDGFNLYYGAAKNTPYKWLDIGELCRQLIRESQ
jgi:hypothetical protein